MGVVGLDSHGLAKPSLQLREHHRDTREQGSSHRESGGGSVRDSERRGPPGSPNIVPPTGDEVEGRDALDRAAAADFVVASLHAAR